MLEREEGGGDARDRATKRQTEQRDSRRYEYRSREIADDTSIVSILHQGGYQSKVPKYDIVFFKRGKVLTFSRQLQDMWMDPRARSHQGPGSRGLESLKAPILLLYVCVCVCVCMGLNSVIIRRASILNPTFFMRPCGSAALLCSTNTHTHTHTHTCI